MYGLITPKHIIVGNIGDSRAVLASGKKTIAMSYDHKPTNVSAMDKWASIGTTN